MSVLDLVGVSGLSRITIDTKANILALTPVAAMIAYASDTEEFYIYDTVNWRVAPLEFNIELQAPDMGAFIPGGLGVPSDKSGYYSDVITDKKLSNIVVQGNARVENGGLRIDVTQDPDTLEIYLRSTWNTIIYDLTTEFGDFRHVPLSEAIYIWRGDSVLLGLNERSIIQEYNVSMGAFPPVRLLDGGTF